MRSCCYHLPSATQILLTFLDTPHHLNTPPSQHPTPSQHLNTPHHLNISPSQHLTILIWI
ncbi:MAG: hypothetical protein SOY53_00790 [Prevotella sp.]|uniref:hypothetical protein n=1 Tax=Leyella stercorea TaxID=363265 RepID=UPI0028013E91|nr:hypothetical protein [Leyella stercorea]MDY4087956.1 hypothetical protein [Prevotella sp.]